MAWGCRRQCKLCRSKDPDCSDEKGKTFCAFWAGLERNACPVWEEDVGKEAKYDPDRLGALILGTTSGPPVRPLVPRDSPLPRHIN